MPYLEHLWPHEVIVINQTYNPIGENHHSLSEQDDDIRCPSDAVKINRILGLAFNHSPHLLTTFILVLFVTVEEGVVKQQCQHNVEH